MRQFALINSIGQRWDLNQENSFLSSPKGLGGERKITYTQIGNSFVELENLLKQKSITGKIVFDDYGMFEEFSLFAQHSPLILVYKTQREYRIQVEMTKLTKTEMENIGLVGDIMLQGLTAWYRQENVENGNTAEGKKFPYAYDYLYTENGMGILEVESDSIEESPIKLIIAGPCVNPSWSLYRNGEVQTTGKVFCTIEKDNRLVIDTTRIPYEIAEYGNDNVMIRDLYQSSDFETERFLFAGYGKTKIVVTQEGNTTQYVAMEVRIEYGTI